MPGLFCPPIIPGLIQYSNIDKLPGHYFLRRLTRFARNDLSFDRHDEKLQGINWQTQHYRHYTLMPEAMGAVLAVTMSTASHKRTMHVFKELIRKQLSTISVDIGPNQCRSANPSNTENIRRIQTKDLVDMAMTKATVNTLVPQTILS